MDNLEGPHIPSVIDTGDAPPQTGGLLAAFWLLFIIAFCHVALRYYSRLVVERHFGFDDWLLGGATVFTVVMAIALTVAAHARGTGGAVTTGTLQAMVAFSFVYWFATGSLKMSVLWFYFNFCRVANLGKSWGVHKSAIVIAIAFTFAHTFVASFLLVFACRPLSVLWTPHTVEEAVNDHCINVKLLAATNSTLGSFTSSLILAIPLVFVRDVKRKTRHPYLYRFCTAAGFLSLGGSILHVLTISIFQSTYRSESNLLLVPLFSILELAFGIIAACLLSYGPLLRRHDINEDPIPTLSNVRLATQKGWHSEKDIAVFSKGRLPNNRTTPDTAYFAEITKKGIVHSVRVDRRVDVRSLAKPDYGELHDINYDKHGQRIGAFRDSHVWFDHVGWGIKRDDKNDTPAVFSSQNAPIQAPMPVKMSSPVKWNAESKWLASMSSAPPSPGYTLSTHGSIQAQLSTDSKPHPQPVPAISKFWPLSSSLPVSVSDPSLVLGPNAAASARPGVPANNSSYIHAPKSLSTSQRRGTPQSLSGTAQNQSSQSQEPEVRGHATMVDFNVGCVGSDSAEVDARGELWSKRFEEHMNKALHDGEAKLKEKLLLDQFAIPERPSSRGMSGESVVNGNQDTETTGGHSENALR